MLALCAAGLASAISSLGLAFGASATDQNYNCATHGSSTCNFAYGPNNWVTNNYGIDYTRNGVCSYTIKIESGGAVKMWASKCTSGYEVLTCNGGEYEIYGYGETQDTNGTYDNLAGTQNNYNYCTSK
jgi:hypothetical protein